MNLNQIDENLLLFLDPAGHYNKQSWDFRIGAINLDENLSSFGRNVVLRFSRNMLLDYCVMSLKMLFFSKGRYRKLIFMNNGLLSNIFDASNASAYRAFAKNHLRKPSTFRQSIVALLPLVLRAETLFIVVFYASPQLLNSNDSPLSDLEANDLMFFSNAAGKLLLTKTETLKTGQGKIVKTTTNPDYVPIMVREFSQVALLSRKMGKAGRLPVVGKHLEASGRHFFTEEYILGQSLLDRLRVLKGRSDTVQVCSILDRLDEWFGIYHASFSGNAVPVSSLYVHLFPLFYECYGNAGTTLLQTGVELLRQFENAYPVLTPIVAHNDLWPGNIIMTESCFIVIDWERATEHRAPFFDFFWMIVSTAFESLAVVDKNHDYSKGVRNFLRCSDEVSCHAFKKLKTFLDRMGITEEYLPHLLFLFFMELSVQGYQILGKRTDMDRIVFGELVYYADSMNLIQDKGWTQSDYPVSGDVNA